MVTKFKPNQRVHVLNAFVNGDGYFVPAGTEGVVFPDIDGLFVIAGKVLVHSEDSEVCGWAFTMLVARDNLDVVL